MRVLVAGATGHLGRPLVAQLRKAGHEVAGTTRTPQRRALVEQMGAEPLLMDALDLTQVRDTVTGWQPEAVIHALTAIPDAGPLRDADLSATNRLRHRGTRNLLTACVHGGVRRVVAESMVFAYGYGDHSSDPLTEDDALPSVGPETSGQQHVNATRDLEHQVTQASHAEQLEGIVLRYGIFYGPGGSWDRIHRLLRWHLMALPGGGDGLVPWIHIEDAAAITVAALEHDQSGQIYNAVDDQAARFRDLVDLFADQLGLSRPWSLPRWIAEHLMPYATRSVTDTRLIIANDKAKQDLGWSLKYPTYHTGIQHLAQFVAPGEPRGRDRA